MIRIMNQIYVIGDEVNKEEYLWHQEFIVLSILS